MCQFDNLVFSTSCLSKSRLHLEVSSIKHSAAARTPSYKSLDTRLFLLIQVSSSRTNQQEDRPNNHSLYTEHTSVLFSYVHLRYTRDPKKMNSQYFDLIPLSSSVSFSSRQNHIK